MRKMNWMIGLLVVIAGSAHPAQASEMPACERHAAAALNAAFPATIDRIHVLDCEFKGSGRAEKVKVCKVTTNIGEHFVVVLSESCDQTVVVYEDGCS